MVILKWLHSMLVGGSPDLTRAAAGQSSDKIKKEEKSHYVDVINAMLVDHAEDLDDLIKVGSPAARRKKLRGKIKTKVKSVISREYDDPDIIEEVTERIADAAEIDPYYKNLFCQDSK